MNRGTDSNRPVDAPRGQARPAANAAETALPLRFPHPAMIAAACLAVVSTWLAARNLSLRAENDSLRTQQRLAEIDGKAAQNRFVERSLLAEALVRDLGARLRRSEDITRLSACTLVPPTGNDTASLAVAVWDPDNQAGLLAAARLAPTAGTQDYQLWLLDSDNPDPVNAGVLRVAEKGDAILPFRPARPVARVAAFAITLEKRGVVPSTPGALVLLGRLPGR